MKLTAPRIKKSKRVDETANTATAIRFHRKQRLLQALEHCRVVAFPHRHQRLVDALVSYIDDKYVTHLVEKIDLDGEKEQRYG